MKARLPTLENPELRDLPKANAQANANPSYGPSCAVRADMVIIGDDASLIVRISFRPEPTMSCHR